MIKGVDVAKYQGVIDWTKAKSNGVQFAILKAINKQNKTEESFERNYKGCIENNIPVGAYNYSYATSVQKAEEDALCMVATLSGKQISMKVWLDVEDSCQKVLGKTLIDIIKAYQKVIESAGFEFGVYTGLSFYKSYIKPYDDLKCPFWIARYPSSDQMRIVDNPQASKKPDIGRSIYAWQYTSKGMVEGIPAKVDMNILYDEAEEIKSKPKLTGKGLAEYCINKLGTPYFYGMKMETLTTEKMNKMHSYYPNTVTEKYIQKAKDKGIVGKTCTDCSGLIGAYRSKQIGSAQLYSTSNKRLNMADLDKFAIGVVLYRKGHVGVYIGNNELIEAKGIDYGTVRSKVDPKKWECGLTFADMDYSYEEKAEGTEHKENPYIEPIITLRKGDKGQSVKWLQFELNEAGYDLEVDGIFGSKTEKAVKQFQQSCKIVVDGLVGKVTISYLTL